MSKSILLIKNFFLNFIHKCTTIRIYHFFVIKQINLVGFCTNYNIWMHQPHKNGAIANINDKFGSQK